MPEIDFVPIAYYTRFFDIAVLGLVMLAFAQCMMGVVLKAGTVKVNAVLAGMRTRVNDNGLRGLMFSNKAINTLKAADYAFLGWRIAKFFIKTRRRR